MAYFSPGEIRILAALAPTAIKTFALFIAAAVLLSWLGVIPIDPFWRQFLAH